MFEHRKNRLLSRPQFFLRLLKCILAAFLIAMIALVIGMVGYHSCEKMSWLDAYLNASMILSGMGPVAELKTDAGKFFAGTYALFSGLVLITIMATVLAPVLHRFLHQFHLEEK